MTSAFCVRDYSNLSPVTLSLEYILGKHFLIVFEWCKHIQAVGDFILLRRVSLNDRNWNQGEYP